MRSASGARRARGHVRWAVLGAIVFALTLAGGLALFWWPSAGNVRVVRLATGTAAPARPTPAFRRAPVVWATPGARLATPASDRSSTPVAPPAPTPTRPTFSPAEQARAATQFGAALRARLPELQDLARRLEEARAARRARPEAAGATAEELALQNHLCEALIAAAEELLPLVDALPLGRAPQDLLARRLSALVAEPNGLREIFQGLAPGAAPDAARLEQLGEEHDRRGAEFDNHPAADGFQEALGRAGLDLNDLDELFRLNDELRLDVP